MRVTIPRFIIIAMEQREVKYSLGSISHIEPRTFGEPGQRTFNLVIEAGNANCTVWLEKEQLFQLGIYLQEVVSAMSLEDKQRHGVSSEPEWSGEGISIDFKAGQIMLSHDPDSNSFRLVAYEREEEGASEEPASVGFSISIAQAETIAEAALRICSAGRPLCFLCGQPINPDGHACPRSNGHTVLEAG